MKSATTPESVGTLGEGFEACAGGTRYKGTGDYPVALHDAASGGWQIVRLFLWFLRYHQGKCYKDVFNRNSFPLRATNFRTDDNYFR